MANYIRFQRGTQAAYDNLKAANRLNDYTLYFIYNSENTNVGSLYIGSRLISGGDSTIISSALKDLIDVDITNSGENYFLVQDATGKWVSTSLETVSALIKTQLGEVDLSGLATKEELSQLINSISTLSNSLDKKVDKVIYKVLITDKEGNPVLDNEGNQTYKEVEGTLVTPEDREKLNALVLDDDGSGIEISGTVNAENVQGLSSWITTNANTYIKNLTEDNLSNSIVDKINFITSVNTDNLAVVNGKLDLNEKVTNTLSAVSNGEINFIKSVDTTVFNVSEIGNLSLLSVPINALTPVLGDFSLLPNANNEKPFTLVDEINNLYDILTWSEIEN